MWRWRPFLILVATAGALGLLFWWMTRSVVAPFDADSLITVTDDVRQTLPEDPAAGDIPPEVRRAVQAARDAFYRGDSTPGVDARRFVVEVGMFESRPQDLRLRDRSSLVTCIAELTVPAPPSGTRVFCGRPGTPAWEAEIIQDYFLSPWEVGMVQLLLAPASGDGIDEAVDPQLDPSVIPRRPPGGV